MKSSAVLAFALILTVSLGAAPQNAKPIPQVTPAAAKSATSPDDLPPLSCTCLMDPQIVEDKATSTPLAYPFDFPFSEYTKDVAAPPTPTMTMTNAAQTQAQAPPKATVVVPTAPAPTPVPLTNGVDGLVVDPSLIPPAVTGTVPELITQLKTQTELIRGLIDKGSFGSIYVPAFQAKDIALALVDDHKKELPEDKQRIAEPAAKKLIRAAWLLDAFGDIGNKQQIVDAFAGFVEAAKDLQSSFPSQP